MPRRTTFLVNNEYYHIFNRGVAQMPIFKDNSDYRRFIDTVIYYQIDLPKPRFSLAFTELQKNLVPKLISIVAFCLMPNHFHFLLRQEREGGITEFLRKLCNSYSRYFNLRNKRQGHLFQGQFKSVHIETNEQLIHLSRYIHLNPLVVYLVNDLNFYKWSSYLEYFHPDVRGICEKEIILGQFKNSDDYIRFVLDQEQYGKDLERVKHQLLDNF